MVDGGVYEQVRDAIIAGIKEIVALVVLLKEQCQALSCPTGRSLK